MCTVCGCSDNTQTQIDGNTLFRYQAQALPIKLKQQHHNADHDHEHSPEKISLEHDLLAKNDSLAKHNRRNLIQRGVFTLNLLSSPGAGKTRILERTIADLGLRFCCQVIEGDQATEQDANRIRKAGAAAVQINTGNGCHLEADMLASAVDILNPPQGALLFVENVGNLVCPALFDLGEHRRVVILSITEGEDKPIKYPYIFHDADLLLINKMDLLPHLEFDLDACINYAKTVNPSLKILCISAQSGEGFAAWYQWLETELKSLPKQ
tara:strand:+ start:41951 stop:42751 length:801 start_codon:yes stop_codon:yes gene_type:complete